MMKDINTYHKTTYVTTRRLGTTLATYEATVSQSANTDTVCLPLES